MTGNVSTAMNPSQRISPPAADRCSGMERSPVFGTPQESVFPVMRRSPQVTPVASGDTSWPDSPQMVCPADFLSPAAVKG